MAGIFAQGNTRELSDTSYDELVDRLRRGGLIRRDLETGEIVERSPMAELAEALKTTAGVYRPTPDEQAILYVVLDTWLGDVHVDGFPEDAMTLRYALFCDIDDRRHQRAPAAS